MRGFATPEASLPQRMLLKADPIEIQSGNDSLATAHESTQSSEHIQPLPHPPAREPNSSHADPGLAPQRVVRANQTS